MGITQEETKERDGFKSRFGVVAATLGSAVGLGNIWRFPYETGNGGGAGFLVVYLLASLLVGLPLMMAEMAIGRAAGTDSVGALSKLLNKSATGTGTSTGAGSEHGTPKTGHRWWSLIGITGLISVVLIISFYSDVVGWVLAYLTKALTSKDLLTQDRAELEAIFGATLETPKTALGWQMVVLIIITSILLLGVTKGIEAVTKKLMPLLALLMIIIAARSLSMEGSIEGVKFLFVPKLGDITTNVIFTALGLAFFKLSLGVGAIMTYGSYFPKEQDIPKTAFTVMFADLIMSLLAGLAIFPAVFALGFDPAAGPSLLFLTLPAVFSSMPGGHLLMIAFFALTGLAAVGALLSLIEVPVSVLSERLNLSRMSALVATLIVLAVTGSLAALSFSTLKHVTFAERNIFDTFDFLTNKILVPAVGVMICAYVAFAWKPSKLSAELTNHNTLANSSLVKAVTKTLLYITPILIAVIIIVGLRNS